MNTQQIRYSDKELEAFKVLITGKLTQAEKELNTTLQSLQDTNNTIAQDKMVSMDDSLVVEEQENLNFLAIRLKKFIEHLRGALERIDNKTYGICRKTKRLIDKKRLLLVPHATLCVDAKKQRID